MQNQVLLSLKAATGGAVSFSGTPANTSSLTEENRQLDIVVYGDGTYITQLFSANDASSVFDTRQKNCGWYSPVTPGIGSSYYVKVVVNSGEGLVGGGAWYQLNSTRSFSTVSVPDFGESTGNYTIYISTTNSDAGIVANSGAFTLSIPEGPFLHTGTLTYDGYDGYNYYGWDSNSSWMDGTDGQYTNGTGTAANMLRFYDIGNATEAGFNADLNGTGDIKIRKNGGAWYTFNRAFAGVYTYNGNPFALFGSGGPVSELYEVIKA